MNWEIANLKKGNEILHTLSADSKQDVDNWAEEVRSARGKIVSAPAEFGEGYYGFVFADPDGHKFNVFICSNVAVPRMNIARQRPVQSFDLEVELGCLFTGAANQYGIFSPRKVPMA